MLLIAVFSFLFWFVLAIPIGAIQIEIARRAFNGFIKSAFAIIFGSMAADFFYGIVALLGVFQFLTNPQIRPYFWLGGAFLLGLLGYFSIRNYYRPHGKRLKGHLLFKKRYSLVTGFLVALSNPLMIIGWLTGAEMANRLGIMYATTYESLLIFIIFGTLGVGAYQALIALILFRLRHFLSERTIGFTSLIFGFILVGLGIYFFIEAILVLTGHHAYLGRGTTLSTLQHFSHH